MAAAGARPLDWTRRVPGGALLLFFLTTIVFTFFAVEFWNVYEMAAAGSLTLLAAVLPLELIYVVYYARPVWTTRVAGDAAHVEAAAKEALAGQAFEPVPKPQGVLRLCSGSLRVQEPPCAIGWTETKGYEGVSGTDVFFVGESRDLKRLAAFRDRIGSALGAPASSA